MPTGPDIAGAMAAIEKRLTDNWNTTKVALENVDPAPADGVWPPVDENGAPVLWVFCELVSIPAHIIGFGKRGGQTVMDEGLVKLYVMAQKGSSLTDARQIATDLGELFRQQKFYDDSPLAYVRTRTPTVGNDPLVSDDGNSVSAASCTVPYEFIRLA